MTAEEIIQALAEPYPACELEFKTEPYPATYIDARTPVKRLNRVLPGLWEFRLIGEPRRDDKGNVSRDACLILRIGGLALEYHATGTESADRGNAEPKAEKGAQSDALKRCCFLAGMGCYIYELPKTIKSNSLTREQVEMAARLAGYDGPIKPEHYGPMNKGRAIQEADSSRAATGTEGQGAAPAANGASGPTPTAPPVGPVTDEPPADKETKERFKVLCGDCGLTTAAQKAQYFGSLSPPLPMEDTAAFFRRAIEVLGEHLKTMRTTAAKAMEANPPQAKAATTDPEKERLLIHIEELETALWDTPDLRRKKHKEMTRSMAIWNDLTQLNVDELLRVEAALVGWCDARDRGVLGTEAPATTNGTQAHMGALRG